MFNKKSTSMRRIFSPPTETRGGRIEMKQQQPLELAYV
jgi:hypothetical protein